MRVPKVPFRLLAISDGCATGRESFPRLEVWLDSLAGAGVEAVQIREKALCDRDLYDLVRRARRRLPAATALLVNGRFDLALAAGADGVHLPASGLPAAAVRRALDRPSAQPSTRQGRLLLGASTHGADEIEAALEGGADYVTFGPVYPTPSKEHYGEPPGLPGLRLASSMAAARAVPVLGLGGVGAESLGEVAATGAAGAAGIGAFSSYESACRMVRRVREIFGPGEASSYDRGHDRSQGHAHRGQDPGDSS